MNNVNTILSRALDNGLITTEEWNQEFYVYVIYRIVWETKNHYILLAVSSEETAKRIVEEFKSKDYFYQKVKVT